ncbi:MAG TPA: rhomboid family intramembrane serine protease [Micromonosporaceae bacterium]
MTQVPPPVPQPVVPVCYRHPKRETYVTCTRCGRPICPECMNDAAVGHQCPECVAEGRRTQRPMRTTFGGTMAGAKGYVTISLIGINVLVALVSFASARGGGLFGGGLGGFLGGYTPLIDWGAIKGLDTYGYTGTDITFKVAAGIADGEYYRLVTAMFLHFGLLHLLMNMWALWVLGRTLEGVLGPVRFLVLYLVAGLGGGVAAYLFSPAGLTAGASGAIFGLFAALFIVLKRLGRDTSSVVPILVLNIAISFVPGISLYGHFGGLLCGAIVALAMAYAPRQRRNLIVAGTAVAMLAVMAVAVVLQTQNLRSTYADRPSAALGGASVEQPVGGSGSSTAQGG